MQIKTIIYLALTIGALLWGAITDYKKREIPNGVHVILIIAGLFSALSVFEHIIGLIFPLLVYIILEVTKKRHVGGGDFKLMGALGFNVGVFTLIAVLLISLIFALLFSKDKKQVPLCTYTFAGYIVGVPLLYGLALVL